MNVPTKTRPCESPNVMNSLSIFSLIVTALELSVPVYGLLLIRRFGFRSVGRFVVAAFCALALLYLARCLKSTASGLPNTELIVAFASGLLLIGMGHLQGLYSQRRQSEFEGQKLSADWQQTLKEKTADLAGTNQQLLAELARHRESEQVLRHSDQQYRFIFAESPQPQWIFDLRSLKVLAVNRAALALFGFTSEEFMTLTTRRLLQPDAAGFFLRDVASPCPKAQSRGRWPFCTKDGRRIEADISAVDLNYDGVPARLLAVLPVIERWYPAPEQRVELTKIEPAWEPNCKIPRSVHLDTRFVESFPNIVARRSPVPVSDPQTTACDSRFVVPTREAFSSPVRHSTPAEPPKAAVPAPKLSDAPRALPAKQSDPRGLQSTPVAPKPAPLRSASGKRTILLVDPDAKTRGLARFVLTRHGYRVIETDCPSTVLALWEGESTNVDVLLTDVSLPEGMSGATLAEQLRQTKPELKVVYTAVPTETESADELMQQNIMPKPYTPDKLLETVRNCLVNREEMSCVLV